jgi:hypothetical protein
MSTGHPILDLIADLYLQVQRRQEENDQLRQQLAEQAANGKAPVEPPEYVHK